MVWACQRVHYLVPHMLMSHSPLYDVNTVTDPLSHVDHVFSTHIAWLGYRPYAVRDSAL